MKPLNEPVRTLGTAGVCRGAARRCRVAHGTAGAAFRGPNETTHAKEVEEGGWSGRSSVGQVAFPSSVTLKKTTHPVEVAKTWAEMA